MGHRVHKRPLARTRRIVREGLVGIIDVVMAPLVVGGSDTPTLVDGPSLALAGELTKLRPLELLVCGTPTCVFGTG